MVYSNLLGLKFPGIFLRGKEKPQRNPHLGNLSRTGFEEEPNCTSIRTQNNFCVQKKILKLLTNKNIITVHFLKNGSIIKVIQPIK